MTRKSCDG